MKNDIFIVDDHPLVAKGLGYFFLHHGFRPVNLYNRDCDVIDAICTQKPEFVILDIHMPDINGIDILKVLNTLDIESKVIIYTGSSSPFYMTECQSAGAAGYLRKDEPLERFLDAFNIIRGGGIYLSSWASQQSENKELALNDYISGLLSRRELETLKLLIKGHSVKEIASMLSLSNKTVSTFKQKIISKLKARNLLEAIDIARNFPS